MSAWLHPARTWSAACALLAILTVHSLAFSGESQLPPNDIIGIRGGEPYIRSVAVSPDGRRVAAGSATGKLRVFDMRTGRLQGSNLASGSFAELAFLADPNVLLARWQWSTPSGSGIGVWQMFPEFPFLAGPLPALKPIADQAPATSVVASRDGSLIAAAGGQYPLGTWRGSVSSGDGFITVWQPQIDKRFQVPLASDDAVTGIVLSPDGRYVVPISLPLHPLQIWDTVGHRWLQLSGSDRKGVVDASFSPDGRWLITASGTASGDAQLTLRTGPRFSVARQIQVSEGVVASADPAALDSIRSVDFTPDGRFVLVYGADGRFAISDIWSNSASRSLVAHPGVQSGYSHAARVVPDIEAYFPWRRLKAPMVSTPAGTLVGLRIGDYDDAFSGRGSVWRINHAGELEMLWQGEQLTTAMAFSPTDPHVVVCAEVKRAPLGYYPLLRLRDAETGKLLRTFSDAHE